MRPQAISSFLTSFQDGVWIGDGAMATLLHQYGAPIRTCYEALSLREPDLVTRAHRAYVEAGANVLQTNTFAAHRLGLDRYGLEDQVALVNRAAVDAARKAANGDALVFGTVGSIAGFHGVMRFYEEDQRRGLTDAYREQAEALLSAGLDGLVLETFADLEDMMTALSCIRPLTDLPILANLSPETVGVTRDGVPIREAFVRMQSAGADVVGLNCRLGPSGVLRTYEGLDLSQSGRYAAVPNAGILHREDNDYSYTGSTQYFAEIAEQLVGFGVRYIGGCCGTTPDHIRAVVERLGGRGADGKRVTSESFPVAPSRTLVLEPVPKTALTVDSTPPRGETARPVSTLLHRVQQETTVIVELDPPKILDCAKFMEGARRLRDAGADFVTLADNSLGTVRVSNMALAALMKQEGIEPLVHVTCRDRNLIGQQSHLMGLNVLGVHHILLVTGDPSKFGDLPGATSVYDVSSIDLTKMVKRLNEGTAFSGAPMKQASSFVIGTSFNPHVRNFHKAIERLHRKVDAGAHYVMTQPIFEESLFERLERATRDLGVPVFVGVMPLVSARNAYFLHHEVPGIDLPETVLSELMSAAPEQAGEVGLGIAKRLVERATQYFRGIYLITPYLRYGLTAELATYAKQQNGTRVASL